MDHCKLINQWCLYLLYTATCHVTQRRTEVPFIGWCWINLFIIIILFSHTEENWWLGTETGLCWPSTVEAVSGEPTLLGSGFPHHHPHPQAKGGFIVAKWLSVGIFSVFRLNFPDEPLYRQCPWPVTGRWEEQGMAWIWSLHQCNRRKFNRHNELPNNRKGCIRDS